MNSPSTRKKTEVDVNLLLACKVQLSSEVIKWKSETLRLQKERDTAQQRSNGLDQTVERLSEKTKELQERLFQAEAENRSLRSRSMFADEEKAAVVQRLSQSFNNCHSFPFEKSLQLSHPKFQDDQFSTNRDWWEASSRLQVSRPKLHNEELSANEDWRVVSQKMLQQMKREMKELNEMSSHFYQDEKVNEVGDTDADCKEELVEGLSSLLTETESLKQHLLEQRQKLHSLFIGLNLGEQQQKENLSFKIGAACNIEPSTINTQLPVTKSKSKKNKAASDNFRKYFAKQLETMEDLNKASRESRPFSSNPTSPQVDSSILKSNTCQTPVIDPTYCVQKGLISETKICPICQTSFDGTVSQTEFEEHVVNHLEKESVSLLDQYVVL